MSVEDELRQFIEQFESLDVEKEEIANRQKEVLAEAKARGYDTKAMKRVISIRKKDVNEVAAEEAIFESYKQALGINV